MLITQLMVQRLSAKCCRAIAIEKPDGVVMKGWARMRVKRRHETEKDITMRSPNKKGYVQRRVEIVRLNVFDGAREVARLICASLSTAKSPNQRP